MRRPEIVYYLVDVLSSLSTYLIAPAYTVFLISKGLDYKGIAIVDGFFVLMVAVLDYPTGGVADKYGRRKVVSLACIFYGLALLNYSFSYTLPQFLFSELLAAIGSALFSGSLLAWLVDSLKEEGRKDQLVRVLGLASAISPIVGAAGSFLGGLLSDHSLALPFAVGAPCAFLASIIAYIGMRGRGEVSSSEERAYMDFLRKGAKILVNSKPLVVLTLGGLMVTMATPCFTLTWAPYMKSMGASGWLLGLASATFIAVSVIGGFLGGMLASGIGYKRAAMLALTLMACAFLLMGVFRGAAAFMFFSVLFEVGLGLLRPVTSAWINEFIPSEERATVISLRRTRLQPFSAVGMAAMGVLSDLGTPRLAYLFGFISTCVAIAIYSRVSMHKHLSKEEI